MNPKTVVYIILYHILEVSVIKLLKLQLTVMKRRVLANMLFWHEALELFVENVISYIKVYCIKFE